MRPPRFTLTQFFLFTNAAGLVLVLAVFLEVHAASSRVILKRSELVRRMAAVRIEGQVDARLGEASDVLEAIDRSATHAAIDMGDSGVVEGRLFSAVLNAPHVASVIFTHAESRGFDDHGEMQLAPEGRWEVAVFRATADAASPILTRTVTQEGDHFVARRRDRPANGTLVDGPLVLDEPGARDPTSPDTFAPPASKSLYGRPIWSDIHYSELDRGVPAPLRRVVLSVQRSVEDSAHHFVGVLKVELFRETIDAVARIKVDGEDDADPHRVFLCDSSGWLVNRFAPGDPIQVHGKDDLRLAPTTAPPMVAAALSLPGLAGVDAAHPDESGAVTLDGEMLLVTFHAIPAGQEWIVGIVVPAEYYTRDLEHLSQRFFQAYGVFLAATLLVVGFALRGVRGAFGRVSDATARMRAFDFAPTESRVAFRDVAAVMEGLERAKTAMRALGKYVPLDLVRQLYAANREPMLGGELRELTILFTDIRGFTTVAEGIAPEVLAPALGRYLEAMIAGIHGTGGTIDKLIGDGVMAFWNAPAPVSDHTRRACSAVLACLASTEALFASPAWVGLPPLFTRFGLHTDAVLVGHFGAPDRLSYTLMGDGVNLASRLEALGKQYGVAVLVSEAVVERVAGDFVFRLVDRVAVKGKTKGVRVYELLGHAGFKGPRLDVARRYERALEAYFARDFDGARALLAAQLHDGPSATLDARAAQFQREPPAEDWDGGFVATSK